MVMGKLCFPPAVGSSKLLEEGFNPFAKFWQPKADLSKVDPGCPLPEG